MKRPGAEPVVSFPAGHPREALRPRAGWIPTWPLSCRGSASAPGPTGRVLPREARDKGETPTTSPRRRSPRPRGGSSALTPGVAESRRPGRGRAERDRPGARRGPDASAPRETQARRERPRPSARRASAAPGRPGARVPPAPPTSVRPGGRPRPSCRPPLSPAPSRPGRLT